MTSVDDDRDSDPRPRNVEAEQAVLGAMMLSPQATGEAVAILTDRDFYRPPHAVVFAAIVDLFEAGEPTDPIAVAQRLERSGNLLRVGGAPYLHSLTSAVPTAANVAYYADLVVDASSRARLVDASQRLLQLATHDAELGEIQERCRETVDAATKGRRERESGVWVGDVIGEHFAGWEAADEDGLPWPYADLQQVTGGMKAGQMIVVAARPRVGKSTILMDVCRHLSPLVPGMFVSLEMMRDELLMRMACAQAKVRYSDVRDRRCTEADWLHLQGAVESIRKMSLRVESPPDATLGGIRALAREQARSSVGLGFLCLDYLQMVQPSDPKASREQQVAAISRGLKALAKELEVPLVVAAQLNRGAGQRADKRPVLEDLRESGQIEADGDLVMLVDRPDATDPECARAGEADLILAKHRNGPQATITVAHQLHYCRLVDIARRGDWQ